MTDLLDLRPDVADALRKGEPVVALESTIISHGMPYPTNLEVARRVEKIIREAGAVPATIGLIEGRIKVGLTAEELSLFAQAADVAKVSTRDLGLVLANGDKGATTVAATMITAALAGIRVFVTGGLGGVHRGAEQSYDVSADLTELGRQKVAVVCAGAKAILDLPKTLEVLETGGVPVIGYGTDEFPAFFSRTSGLPLAARVETAKDAARVMKSHWDLGLESGLVLANPLPDAAALDQEQVEAYIGQALAEADAERITGKDVTPFLLRRLGELSAGRTLQANIALVENNARIGGALAVAYAKL
ncbi:pseudouridine-5'-phosphate glycosidase [Denitrobaculum tricleocarpae]|uniref:Pseudouridine-5'-phosphate glycosidase n=1 Tax=Denitrobaculum tricleocarpae TaxID=2591009 RepID=A0A545TKI8_9PROT|nr:pseudouridine-5'-phosphate glycosidase [Denitrobaculum tricleocarpae]TQV77742.1 pseudouridine-5'-phosphate glycosidase [Denitrobaculum tricleocarpae]